VRTENGYLHHLAGRFEWRSKLNSEKGVRTMYIYDQGRTGSIAPGIGWLDAFGKSQKKTAQESAEAKRLEDEMTKLAAKAAWSGVDKTYEEWL
jgi:hypothetical protein